ncbi:MAG: hypothetical protein GY757_38745 [bacterium]|nr:hypothetical protein [bacterium]
MYSVEEMKVKFGHCFEEEQAEVLSVIIDDAYNNLVKVGDFNELKDIVGALGIKMAELADAQKRTEVKVEALVESQKKTEIELHTLTVEVRKLAEAQNRSEGEIKGLKKEVEGLAQAVGYGLEDKIMPFMKDFVKKSFGINASLVERTNILYPDGNFDEANIYIEGTKDGKKTFVLGECKVQPGKKDVKKFNGLLERARTALDGEIVAFLVGSSIHPAVETFLREQYPGISFFKSYEFEAKYVNDSPHD